MLGRVSEEAYPLSPMQQGMLFHSLSEPSSGVYIQQKLLSLREALDIDAFSAAWQCIVDRHSILRTRFRLNEPQGQVQSVSSHVAVAFEEEDWRSLPKPDRQSRMRDFLAADRRRGPNYPQTPPLALRRVSNGESRNQLEFEFEMSNLKYLLHCVIRPAERYLPREKVRALKTLEQKALAR